MSPVKLRLRDLAEAQNLTISAVQRSTGLDLGMVRRYWHNRTRSVNLDALAKLAHYLGVKPGDLIEDTGERT